MNPGIRLTSEMCPSTVAEKTQVHALFPYCIIVGRWMYLSVYTCPDISDEQQGELSWAHIGADTACISKCGACQIMWMHDVCQDDTREVSGGMGVSSVSAGVAAPWCAEWCVPGHMDAWRQTTTMCGYKCQDAWIVWQMWEEGCQDVGNAWRWGDLDVCSTRCNTSPLYMPSHLLRCVMHRSFGCVNPRESNMQIRKSLKGDDYFKWYRPLTAIVENHGECAIPFGNLRDPAHSNL